MVDILQSKVVGTNKETWYKLIGTSSDVKPTGEFPEGTGHTVAPNSTFFETITEIKYEFDGTSWTPKGQVDFKLQDKEASPSTSQQTIIPDTGYDALSSVEIAAVTADIDENIIAENIKKDVEILGVTGTLEVSDDNAKFIYTGTAVPFQPSKSLKSIKIPAGFSIISSGAFMDYSEVTEVDIPDGVTTINNNAFLRATKLTSITMPNSVTTIGESAFQSCSSLESIEIPSNVLTIGSRAFLGCSSLTSIEIPNSVRGIGGYAFEDCTNLTTITIHKAEGSITGAPWGAPETTQIIWDGE